MQTQNTPNEPISYDGRVGQLYKIFFLNIILGIITLGIYHFWGKTRYRRYETSSFSLLKDRFEYTGYGGELFWGFIKAIVILGILSIPLFWSLVLFDDISDQLKDIEKSTKAAAVEIAPHQGTAPNAAPNATAPTAAGVGETHETNPIDKLSPEDQDTFYTALWIIIGYWLFYAIYIPFVAVYGSLRYRASRTRWRGIRGHMTGSSIIYGFVGLWHLFWKVVTLSLWLPFGDAMLFKYKMKRLTFGNQPAEFTPQYGTLFWSHISTLLVTAVLTSVVFALCVAYVLHLNAVSAIPNDVHVIFEKIAQAINHDVHNKSILVFIPLLSLIIIGFISRFWYRATLVRVQYNNLHFGNLGFRCRIGGFALFRQQLGNFFILLLTLRLATPWVTQRRQRFFCKNVQVTGEVDKAAIGQAVGEKDKWGEGVSSAFDINIGLF